MADATGAVAQAHWRTRFAERVVPIAFCLSLVGIAGLGILAQYVLARTHESEAWVLNTAIAIARLERFHQTLLEAESSGRAFLVTGHSTFRESYRKTLASIDGQLHEIRSLNLENSAEQELARQLEQQINTRFAFLEGQIGVRTAGGFEAVQSSQIRTGAEEMQAMTRILNKMKQTENELLTERVTARKRQNAYLEMGLVVIAAVGMIVMAALFWYMDRLWKQRREAELKAVHLAHHDTLTGLPNRRLLQDRVAIGLARAKRYNEMLAILCFDLDGFKPVNDRYGHDAGDRLLRMVGERFQAVLRAEDTVARVGGDEFVVSLPGITEATYSEFVAAKILKSISAPYTLGSASVSIATSVGIALYPIHGSTLEELLKRGDEALYEAKRLGKSRYVMFTHTDNFIEQQSVDAA